MPSRNIDPAILTPRRHIRGFSSEHQAVRHALGETLGVPFSSRRLYPLADVAHLIPARAFARTSRSSLFFWSLRSARAM
jgi:hypothetical protein